MEQREVKLKTNYAMTQILKTAKKDFKVAILTIPN